MIRKPHFSTSIPEALTFDDVLLKPAASSVLPAEAALLRG
jgi:IMP dehydrogenase/GMP reductase